MSKHTHIPWPELAKPLVRTGKRLFDQRPRHYGNCAVMSYDDYAYARSCVNVHAGLVAALKNAVQELERLRDVHLPRFDDKIGEPDLDVLDQARAALKAAKEDTP